jgi:ADP-ribose pyrophosphatase YjhB (NUDIX family)
MGDKDVRGPQAITSAFIEKGGKFLIVFCPSFKTWRVPGGRVEWNESLEDTLKREMREEVGVEIENPRFLGFGQDHQFHVRGQFETSRLIMYFHVKTKKEPRIDTNEAEKSKWITFRELKVLKDKEGALHDFFKRNPELKL